MLSSFPTSALQKTPVSLFNMQMPYNTAIRIINLAEIPKIIHTTEVDIPFKCNWKDH